VPNSHDHLGDSGILEMQLLDEGEDARGVGRFLCIPVAPLGEKAKER
jgi:hypothetical protein